MAVITMMMTTTTIITASTAPPTELITMIKVALPVTYKTTSVLAGKKLARHESRSARLDIKNIQRRTFQELETGHLPTYEALVVS